MAVESRVVFFVPGIESIVSALYEDLAPLDEASGEEGRDDADHDFLEECRMHFCLLGRAEAVPLARQSRSSRSREFPMLLGVRATARKRPVIQGKAVAIAPPLHERIIVQNLDLLGHDFRWFRVMRVRRSLAHVRGRPF